MTEPAPGAWYLVDGETGLPIRKLRPEEHPSFDPPQMLPPPQLPDYRGLLADRLRRLGACCGLHVSTCCDPDDCGPCCENCPTCPTLARMAPRTPAPPTLEELVALSAGPTVTDLVNVHARRLYGA